MEEEPIPATKEMSGIPSSDDVPAKPKSVDPNISTRKKLSRKTKIALTIAIIFFASCVLWFVSPGPRGNQSKTSASIDNGSNTSSGDNSSVDGDDSSDKSSDKADDKTASDKEESDRVINEFNKHMVDTETGGILDVDKDTLVPDKSKTEAVKQRLHEALDALRALPEAEELTPEIKDVMRKYWYGDLTGNAGHVLSTLWSDHNATEQDVRIYTSKPDDPDFVKVSFSLHSDALNKTWFIDGWYDLRIKQFKLSSIG